jgi:copper chaperone
METLKFKTNLKCSGCVDAVKENMNALNNVANWEVDLTSTDKILSVVGDVNQEEVTKAFEKAGYQAIPLV